MSADFTDKELELINDWLDGTNHMADVCKMHGHRIGSLYVFLTNDRVADFIARITTLLELRARHMLADAKVQSIARLRSILETANNPETARRAATSLLEYRLSSPPTTGGRGEGQGGVGSPPKPPPSQPTPTPPIRHAPQSRGVHPAHSSPTPHDRAQTRTLSTPSTSHPLCPSASSAYGSAPSSPGTAPSPLHLLTSSPAPPVLLPPRPSASSACGSASSSPGTTPAPGRTPSPVHPLTSSPAPSPRPSAPPPPPPRSAFLPAPPTNAALLRSAAGSTKPPQSTLPACRT